MEFHKALSRSLVHSHSSVCVSVSMKQFMTLNLNVLNGDVSINQKISLDIQMEGKLGTTFPFPACKQEAAN